jgi:hypothetical protein
VLQLDILELRVGLLLRGSLLALQVLEAIYLLTCLFGQFLNFSKQCLILLLSRKQLSL